MKDISDFLNACSNNQFNEVSSFVKDVPNIVYQKNSIGWTGLIVCCFHNHFELAKFLVIKGAKVNESNNKGTSVLMYAKTPVIQQGCSTDLLSFLIKEGAEINHKDCYNKTILDYCIELNAIVLSDWLIKHGAKKSKC